MPWTTGALPLPPVRRPRRLGWVGRWAGWSRNRSPSPRRSGSIAWRWLAARLVFPSGPIGRTALIRCCCASSPLSCAILICASLNRFIALESHGSDNVTAQLRLLKAMLFQHGEPSVAALENGVAILEQTDLRADLPHIACPILLLMGQRDQLAPCCRRSGFVAFLA